MSERSSKPLPPQDSAREMWLLTELGSFGRKSIQVEQYEELRAFAVKLALRVEETARAVEHDARWEEGFRRIVGLLLGTGARFEISDVVETVRALRQVARMAQPFAVHSDTCPTCAQAGEPCAKLQLANAFDALEVEP